MKTNRLYAITVYLLNHGKTTAGELAHRFEVSVRTIQRDIDALCSAGIPVMAETGAAGGYSLMDTFTMDRHMATQEDYTHILTALRGLLSATNNRGVQTTIEKLEVLTKAESSGLILDFSALREGDEKLLQSLQSAIRAKRAVSFTYTNTENITRTHKVEPIAALYRWYAWYLLAYSRAKNDYLTYKLVRMSGLSVTDTGFTKEHESADAVLRMADKGDNREVTEVRICCKSSARARAVEYLNGKITKEMKNGDVLMTLHVIESEHFWFGTMLSLGDGIEVLAPERIRRRVLKAARNILILYREL